MAGKRKRGDAAAPIEKIDCGICLVEYGEADRGKLDCCDHFFCLRCIKEWSRVESRCPFCKQRFEAITHRGKKSRVRRRDQVYDPDEEDLAALSVGAICSICCEGDDEGFLLLCDRCDGAAHTYCSGLDYEVPTGNWYCSACEEKRAEQQRFIASPSSSGAEAAELEPVTELETLEEIVSMSATTVMARRTIHQRVREIRDNWEALRSGVASFPASDSRATRRDDAKREKKKKATNEIDKAWKMMDKAISLTVGVGSSRSQDRQRRTSSRAIDRSHSSSSSSASTRQRRRPS